MRVCVLKRTPLNNELKNTKCNIVVQNLSQIIFFHLINVTLLTKLGLFHNLTSIMTLGCLIELQPHFDAITCSNPNFRAETTQESGERLDCMAG